MPTTSVRSAATCEAPDLPPTCFTERAWVPVTINRTDTFCDVVLANVAPLIVLDADQEPWIHMPGKQMVGTKSYIGVPILLSDSRCGMFAGMSLELKPHQHFLLVENDAQEAAILDRAFQAIPDCGTVAIARWVGSVDRQRFTRVLDGASDPEDLHELYEGDDEPSNVKPIIAVRAAA